MAVVESPGRTFSGGFDSVTTTLKSFASCVLVVVCVVVNPELRSTLFLVPGLIAYISMITAVVSTALSIVREKENGTMEQVRMAPISTPSFIVGKTLPYLLLSQASATLVIAASMVLFALPLRGSWFALSIVLALFLIGALGTGLLISTMADTQQVAFEYPGAGGPGDRRLLIYEQRLWSTNYPHNCDSGAEFYGTKGQMFLSRRGKIELRGDRNLVLDVPIKLESQNDVAHVRNFCDAIRTGARLNADALTGHLSTSLCHLGNIATRLGRSLVFNPQTEQIIGDTEANGLVRRDYRDHWGTPRNVSPA